MLAAFYKSKLFLVFETLVLIILPLTLLDLFPGWMVYRYWIMLGGLFYVLLFVRSQRLGWKELGFQAANFNQSATTLIRPTLLAMLFIVVLYKRLPINVVYPLEVLGPPTYPILFSVFRYSFISVTLQEIIFRSYLINRARLVINNQWLIRVYATVIFMLIHIPYKTPVVTLGSLALGWIWVGNFLKFKNIYSIILSHILVGLTYVLLMFLTQ